MSAAAAARRDRAARRAARRDTASVAAAEVLIDDVPPGVEIVSAPIEGEALDALPMALDAAARARAAALARVVREACDDAEARLGAAVAARDEQQMAWLVLCDRGWPSGDTEPQRAFEAVRAWLAHWTTLVAMPVKIGLTDRLRLRGIQQRLTEAERALRPALPPALWQLVEPLDDTGRATLAHALHAIVRLDDATQRAAAASEDKAALRNRFAAFAPVAATLSLEVPEALLDLDAWRTLATSAAALAGQDDTSQEIAGP